MGHDAIFAGSFNPFTKGHASIVRRGLEIFNRIIIVVGVNVDKPGDDADQRASKIRELYNNNERVAVITWDGLMVDLAVDMGVRFFIRGVRNCTDFEYEKTMANINRKLAGVETVFLPSLPEHEDISSSIVRELNHFGVDISDMIP